MPVAPGLMLCTLVEEPFDDPAWLFEPKLDGLRVWCRFDGKRVSLLSRNAIEQGRAFPEIVDALGRSLKKPGIVDGEIVCLDENGQSSFRTLQQRFHISDPETVARRAKLYPAYLFLFDILHCDRFDVTPLPLVERKRILKSAVKWSKKIRYTPGTKGAGINMLREMCAKHGEGIVGKRLTSPYVAKRNGDWVKIKCSHRQEFVIGGYTDPQGARAGLGALLMGYHENGDFVYAGKVGTGFSDQFLQELARELKDLKQSASPFTRGDPPHGKAVHWVKPKLVAELAFSEWTQNGMLRHPRFEGLRMDKGASKVKRERPQSAGEVVKAKKTTARRGKASNVDADEVQFTHLDRVVFPDSGITKGDVLEFYANVADKLLPHLKDRPVTMERYPAGVRARAPHFWQKNIPEYYPAWVKRVKLKTEDGKPVEYALVNDLRTLLYLVNQNVLTFHTWFSRVKDLDVPDFVLFDIDPHQSTFANAVTVAKKVHEILDDEGVENFIKTTGKSGLHVTTPWPKKRGGFDKARTWAEEIAQRVADALPKIATTERRIAKRGNRVYVDAMQNAKGKHAVPPYVIRATELGTVAMPLEWKELNGKLTPRKFDLKTAMKRIAGMKRDPLETLIGK